MWKPLRFMLQIYANMADESKRESVNRITLKPKITPQLKVVGQG